MSNLQPVNHPLYLKLAQIIMGLTGFFFILYVGRPILVPIIFATIIAILLNPVVNYLVKKGVNNIIAISIALLITLVFLTGLIWFIVSQTAKFTDSLPQFKESFQHMFDDAVNWTSDTFSISREKIKAFIARIKSGSMENSAAMIGSTLAALSNLFALLFLLPVYIFMVLYYKPLLLEFIARLFKKDKHQMVAEVLIESKGVIQSYLSGLLLEAVIVAILNSIGLLVLGIHYALLLGILGAILNIIPYIGGLVAISLPVIMAFATKSPASALWVIVLYSIIQFVDNNVIVPKIVASKVRMNALVSIIVVLIGGTLWGIPGMFLSIPLTAITKVICDRVETLKPFGFLIGDNQPEIGKVILHFGRPSKKKANPSAPAYHSNS